MHTARQHAGYLRLQHLVCHIPRGVESGYAKWRSVVGFLSFVCSLDMAGAERCSYFIHGAIESRCREGLQLPRSPPLTTTLSRRQVIRIKRAIHSFARPVGPATEQDASRKQTPPVFSRRLSQATATADTADPRAASRSKTAQDCNPAIDPGRFLWLRTKKPRGGQIIKCRGCGSNMWLRTSARFPFSPPK